MRIDAKLAKKFFDAYHKSTHLAQSHGVLRLGEEANDTQAIQHFIISHEEVIKPLQSLFPSDGFVFDGLACIPVYNTDTHCHTLVIMAVAINSQGLRKYFLPPDQNNTNYLFEHLEKCPSQCDLIDNTDRIWQSFSE
jgi:hypothetical protein